MRDVFSLAWPFAETVLVKEGAQQRTARAIIQPISTRSPAHSGRPTAAGVADDRLYLLIIEPTGLISGSDTRIEHGGRRYRLLRCEYMPGGSHWEGIMKLAGVTDDVF